MGVELGVVLEEGPEANVSADWSVSTVGLGRAPVEQPAIARMVSAHNPEAGRTLSMDSDSPPGTDLRTGILDMGSPK
jgi:hypothetical protein